MNRRNMLSSIISICLGIFLFIVSIKGFWSNSFIGDGEIMAIGFFLLTTGIILFFLQIFKIKNKKIILYIGIIIGILLVITGLFLMRGNYEDFAVAVMATGTILFLPNYIGLLRRKFPNKEFFDKKPYNKTSLFCRLHRQNKTN